MDLFQPVATAGGWGGPSAAPTPVGDNWSSSPWSESGSAKTWSQITSKGVQPPAVKPKNFDSTNPAIQSPNWASPQSVDQGTPWGGNDKPVKQNDWSNQQNNALGWENGAKANSWQPPAQKPIKTNVPNNGADYWQKNSKSTSQSNQWNEPTTGASGWDDSVAQPARWTPEAAAPAPVPSNVWTGPPSSKDSVVDSSMIWNNPNPKKVVQPDKGTNCWGDPTSQFEIKRWKSSEEGSQSAVAPQQSSSSMSSGGQQQQQQQTSTSSCWQDSPIAPNSQKMSSSGWNDQPTGTQDGSIASAQAANVPAMWDVVSDKTVPSSTWGGNNAWPANNSSDCNRQSSGNLSAGDDGIDDVFSSNPTTPVTPRGPRVNATPSNLPANLCAVSQQLTNQQQTQATGRPMQNNQQLQMLSKHIADQLKSAVQAGMIDISIICQPLPQESLLQLNTLLQIKPKLMQAQEELQHLQRQNDRLNETQIQEAKRLNEDINRYNVMIQQIKQQINAKARPPSANNMSNGPEIMSPINGATDNSFMGSQSKLMQWSKSAGNGLDQKLNVSSSAPNLENLEHNLNSMGFGNTANNVVSDLWSIKRHSGADWPTAIDSMKGDSNELLNSLTWGRPDVQSEEMRQMLPPEFKPGTPWEWRDPNKMAEDPNATPGSVKPSALNKLPFDSTGFPNFSNFGVNMQSSSFYGSNTPTKMNFDMKPSNVSPSFNAPDQYAMPRYGRPPSQIGQPYVNRPPMMKNPPPFNTAPNNFMPYANNMAQWVVLTNLSQIDDRSLQATVSRYGTTTTVVSPPGSGFVFLKFHESSFERLLPRMQQELAPYGVSVQIMKESEVERLLQVLHNRPASTLFASNNSTNNVHLPPPHSNMWDGPPPPMMGASANTGVHPYAAPPEMTQAQDASAALAQQVMPQMHMNQIVM